MATCSTPTAVKEIDDEIGPVPPSGCRSVARRAQRSAPRGRGRLGGPQEVGLGEPVEMSPSREDLRSDLAGHVLEEIVPHVGKLESKCG